MPAPALIFSIPDPAVTESTPSPSVITLAPAVPTTVSLPPPILIVSALLPAVNLSGPAPPVNVIFLNPVVSAATSEASTSNTAPSRRSRAEASIVMFFKPVAASSKSAPKSRAVAVLPNGLSIITIFSKAVTVSPTSSSPVGPAGLPVRYTYNVSVPVPPVIVPSLAAPSNSADATYTCEVTLAKLTKLSVIASSLTIAAAPNFANRTVVSFV